MHTTHHPERNDHPPAVTAGRRRMRTSAALGVLLATVLVLSTAGRAAAAPPTEDGPTAARYGAAWLANELDGQIPMINFGSPDWGVTLDAALALAATGTAGTQLDAVWATLLGDRDAAVAPGGIDAPGRLARAILLARVLGEDPRAVGSEPGADLVARLQATRQTSGADTGLYGETTPLYDGAFRQGYALAALVAVGETPDPSAVTWLVDQQCTGADDGAWMPYRDDLSEPCAFDAGLYVGPDTNATAAAVTGLHAVGGHDGAVDEAVAWLDDVQTADGGWEQLSGFGTDPNSTALVMQALLAVGAADDPRFEDRAATPLEALLAFQLGCDALPGDEGSFTFPGSNDAPNGFATAQAVPAAAGVPAVFDPGVIAPAAQPLECGDVTTTTTTVPDTSVPPTTEAPTTTAPSSTAPTSTGPDGSTPVEVANLSASSGSTGSTTSGSTTSGSQLALTGTGAGAVTSFGAAMLLGGLALLLARRVRSAADA